MKWQPINSAPIDEEILLYIGGKIIIGKHARKFRDRDHSDPDDAPRPSYLLWTTNGDSLFRDGGRFSKRDLVLWAPLEHPSLEEIEAGSNVTSEIVAQENERYRKGSKALVDYALINLFENPLLLDKKFPDGTTYDQFRDHCVARGLWPIPGRHDNSTDRSEP